MVNENTLLAQLNLTLEKIGGPHKLYPSVNGDVHKCMYWSNNCRVTFPCDGYNKIQHEFEC